MRAIRLGNVGNTSMETVREKAKKAGYTELNPVDGSYGFYNKQKGYCIVIFFDGEIVGGAF